MTSASLRLRLTLIILGPLLTISIAVGLWQIRDARDTAAYVFDRSLLFTALAVASDIAQSDGDALSIETRDRLADTSGGPVFYHAFAPDGIYVTGYATPPVPVGLTHLPEGDLVFYDALYHGHTVRAVRIQDITTVGVISGVFTYTVWQDVALRDAFVRDLVTRSFVVILVLIGTVALVVWFGVSLGLRPLLDLEDAISKRSSDDLSPIQRPVPPEARGLVRRLNILFSQVEAALVTQTNLISNAAHQLRNPLAGVLAMAEAVNSAPDAATAQARSGELLEAARRASDLANKLLTLERVRAAPPQTLNRAVDLSQLVAGVADDHRTAAAARDVRLSTSLPPGPVFAVADAVMLREAVANLTDNALRHGGKALTQVQISLRQDDDATVIEVADDGTGLNENDVDRVLARFGQAQAGEGSGLGLSIADAVATRHGGALSLDTARQGLRVIFRLPAEKTAVA